MGALLLERAKNEIFRTDALSEEFGWIAWLTPTHLRLFAGEFLQAAESAKQDDVSISELLDAWKATAEVDASPEVQKEIERNRASARFASVDEWLIKRHGIA